MPRRVFAAPAVAILLAVAGCGSTDPKCVPTCPAGACGDDGCGGSCGTPSCGPYNCGGGPDGCGGTCPAHYEAPVGRYVGSGGDLVLSGTPTAVKATGSLAVWTYDGLSGIYSTGTFINGQLHFFTVIPNSHCKTVDAVLDSSTQILTGEHCDGTLTFTNPVTCTKGTCFPFTLTYDPTCE